MKIKNTNPENIKSIIDPEDRAGANAKAIANTWTSKGIGSMKGGFELARSQTTLDKMIEGKVRESTVEVKNILIGLKAQDAKQVQQNQAETLKAQTQNVKTDGSVKFALKKLEVDECIMKAPGADELIDPEDHEM